MMQHTINPEKKKARNSRNDKKMEDPITEIKSQSNQK